MFVSLKYNFVVLHIYISSLKFQILLTAGTKQATQHPKNPRKMNVPEVCTSAILI